MQKFYTLRWLEVVNLRVQCYKCGCWHTSKFCGENVHWWHSNTEICESFLP